MARAEVMAKAEATPKVEATPKAEVKTTFKVAAISHSPFIRGVFV
jgi:hypothetical protein